MGISVCQVVGNLPCKFVASWVLHLPILKSAMRDWWQLLHLAVPSIYGAKIRGIGERGTQGQDGEENSQTTHLKMVLKPW